MKTRRYKKHKRHIKRRTRRRQRGGLIITKYLGGMPVAKNQRPTLVDRATDLDPRESPFSVKAAFDLPKAFELSDEPFP